MRTPPAPANDDAAYYHQVLHDLIDTGMELARALHNQAIAAKSAQPRISIVEAAEAYERIARAIRRTVLLDMRANEPAQSTAPNRAAARRHIMRQVEDVIDRNAAPAARDALAAELHERLDGPDILEDVGNRPVPDIIAEICRDLGLANVPGLKPYKRRTPDDIAALCARAAQFPDYGKTGSPAAAPPNDPERFFRLVPSPITP